MSLPSLSERLTSLDAGSLTLHNFRYFSGSPTIEANSFDSRLVHLLRPVYFM